MYECVESGLSDNAGTEDLGRRSPYGRLGCVPRCGEEARVGCDAG